jgi:undecaprenyl-diphosphatase
MRTFVNSVAHLDIVFTTAIFGLNKRKILSLAMPWVSHSGNGYYYPVIPAVLLFVDPLSAWNFFLAGLFAFGIELPLYKLLKNRIKRDRPCQRLSSIHQRISPSDQFSFPSGHTAAAFVVATLLGYLFPIIALPLFTWALLVGFSRIYLGVHYPSDILVGIVIGMLSAISALAVVIQ